MRMQVIRDRMHRVRSIFLRADRLAEVALAERYGEAFHGSGGDLLLMVDVGTPGRRPLAADFAAVLAASAVRAGDRVGLVLFSSDVELYLPPSRDRNHLRRVVRPLRLRVTSRRRRPSVPSRRDTTSPARSRRESRG